MDKKRTNLFALGWLVVFACFSWDGVSAQEQIITPNPTSQNIGQLEPLSLDVVYSTANPQDETLSGLGLRMHWNS